MTALPPTSTSPPDYQVTAWMYHAAYAEQKTIQGSAGLLDEANYLCQQSPVCSISCANQKPAAIAQNPKLGVRSMPSINNVFDARCKFIKSAPLPEQYTFCEIGCP
jgi:hypothetical protein